MQWVLPLPDEFFLLAHDDYNGAPLVNRGVLASGLTGAMLAEMVICGRIEIADGRVRLRDNRSWRGDDEAVAVTLREIANQAAPKLVRAWVEYLRDHLYDRVANSLAIRGIVERESGGVLRRATRFRAVDPLVAARARVGLRYTPERAAAQLEERTAALGALAIAANLEDVVADRANRDAREMLRAMAGQLRPDLRAVVGAVDTAVRAIVLVPGR
jgi:hypothetical protein